MIATPNRNEKILLVEGKDDEHVIRHVAWKLSLETSFEIIDTEGKGIFDAIDVGLKSPSLETIGVVADADDNLLGRWQSIVNRIQKIERNPGIPEKPQEEGVIVDSEPRVGIWLMPDNNGPGEIEDFVAGMIPENDPVWPRAERYIQDIPLEHLRSKVSKAKLYAWLATRETPGRMGTAIGAGALRTDGERTRVFGQWLQELFRLSGLQSSD